MMKFSSFKAAIAQARLGVEILNGGLNLCKDLIISSFAMPYPTRIPPNP